MKKSLLLIAGIATASFVALTAFYTEEKTDQQLIDVKVEEMVTKFKVESDAACRAEALSEATSRAALVVDSLKAAALKAPGKKVIKPKKPAITPPAAPPVPPAAPPVDPQKGRGGTTPGGKVEDQKARGGTSPEGGKVQDQKGRGGK